MTDSVIVPILKEIWVKKERKSQPSIWYTGPAGLAFTESKEKRNRWFTIQSTSLIV